MILHNGLNITHRQGNVVAMNAIYTDLKRITTAFYIQLRNNIFSAQALPDLPG